MYSDKRTLEKTLPTLKPSKGRCASFNYTSDGSLVNCPNEGIRRYDHGLDSGIHCEDHWEQLLASAREQSW